LESLGGSAEGGPPTRTGFFYKQEFGPILGADNASRDDVGIIEYEEIFWGEEGREITDRSIGHFSGCSINVEETGRVPRMGGCGGNSSWGDGDRKEFL